MNAIGWLCPCGNWGFVWNDADFKAPCGCTLEDVQWQTLNSVDARAALDMVLPGQEAVEKAPGHGDADTGGVTMAATKGKCPLCCNVFNHEEEDNETT